MKYDTGAYSLINDFRNLADEEGIVYKKSRDLLGKNLDKSVSSLYTDDYVILIHNNIINAAPGKARGETLKSSYNINDGNYVKLKSKTRWRKKLHDSELLSKQLELDGKKWLSVEQYMIAIKNKYSDSIEKESVNISEYLYNALKQKFEIKEYKEILLLTNDAKLNIYVKDKPDIVAKELMQIRENLKKEVTK